MRTQCFILKLCYYSTKKYNYFLKHLIFILNFTAVKWINLILSIYLVVLSCLPCADTLENETIAHTSEIVSKDNQSHEKGLDLCAPFCSCNCCAVQVLNSAPAVTWIFNVETTLIKKPLSSYHSILTSNFYGSIWQPPQIA